MRLAAIALITAGLLFCLAGAATAQQTPTPVPPTATPKPPAAAPTPNPAERLADRAIALLAGWKVKAAENLLAANEQEFGTTSEYRTALGYLRAAQGKWEEATGLLRGAATARPADPAPQYYLGESMNWRQKPADADTAWKAATTRATAQVEALPTDPRAQYYLGAAKVRLKQLGQARTALEAARTAGFDPVLVDYQTGLSYTLEEKWQLAVESFDKVVAKDAKFAHAYLYRGIAWGKLGRKDRLLVDLDLFIKLAPNAPEAGIAKATLAAAQR